MLYLNEVINVPEGYIEVIINLMNEILFRYFVLVCTYM